MIQKFWHAIPAGTRRRLIRLSQTKFTASAAAVIVKPEGQVLLLKHVLRPGTGWGLPGGFIDRGEQPEDAIRREIEEETGLRLNRLEQFRIRVVGTHIEFLFTATPVGEASVGSREIIELGWFRSDELPEGLSRVQAEIVKKVLDGRD